MTRWFMICAHATSSTWAALKVVALCGSLPCWSYLRSRGRRGWWMNVGCWDAHVLHIYYLLTYTSYIYNILYIYIHSRYTLYMYTLVFLKLYTNLVAICFNPWIDGTTLSQISACFFFYPQRQKKQVISVDLSLEQAYWWAGSVWTVMGTKLRFQWQSVLT